MNNNYIWFQYYIIIWKKVSIYLVVLWFATLFRFNWGFFYIVIAKISMMNFISFSDVIKILSIRNKYFSWIKIWKLKLSEIHNRTKNLNCKSDKYSTGTKFLFCYYTVSTTKNEGFSTLNHMLLNLYFFFCICHKLLIMLKWY